MGKNRVDDDDDDYSVDDVFDDDDDDDEYDDDDDDDDGANYVEEVVAPKKKAVTAAAPKKAAAVAPAKKTGKSSASDPGPAKKPAAAKKKAASAEDGRELEEIYQRMDPREHVLIRPDTYVGSVEVEQQKLYVWDDVSESMVQREINFVPGLYKIFDEILVNAADNFQRDSTMSSILVTIDAENCCITVQNDGKGIPVEIHKKENMYIPQLIFGRLLAGGNFDDSMRRVVGGRNGYGAKLANIFSTRFDIETVDSERGKRYTQRWEKNMTVEHEPVIKATRPGEKDFTKVTFFPELSRFHLTEFTPDIIALFKKRVYDIAGCNSALKVRLNGQLLPVKSFEKYCELYFKGRDVPYAYERLGPRWEVLVAASLDGFDTVSFVNSIWTIRGGSHVDQVVRKVSKPLMDAIEKKNKGVPVKLHQIRTYLFVFVNCLIENPEFDGQTKETLKTQVSRFGSTFELSEPFSKKVVGKLGIVSSVLNWARFKQDEVLKKTVGAKKSKRLSGIPKLADANLAGTKHSRSCTLILTEGDSAMTSAIAGISEVGRDHFGIFPLKGKLLNVREATHSSVTNNAEIVNIMRILGLKIGEKYEDVNTLRYGRLMIMTDQDHDGSHIKGLIINLVHNYWPSLLHLSGFLCEFITPIVKVTRANAKPQSFFTLTEYERWRESFGEAGPVGWKVKYYKGLGTNTPQEFKDYFRAIANHKIDFQYASEADDRCIELAFSKHKADERKRWIEAFVPGTIVDNSVKKLGYADFINKELIHFSIADCQRSIPSLVDGFKPGQRKILFACFKRNLRDDIKVAQLSGYVSEQAAYHHGETSLQSTIVGMAQAFVWANNINLLYPSGAFGSRRLGGKDAASARYIYTRLSSITRYIFRREDDALLNYLDDDGFSVEPEWYIPILPMILVNGVAGIGTGWSTSVPNYNPRDIVKILRLMISGEAGEELHPWYRGFLGDIDWEEGAKLARYKVTGRFERPDPETLIITELPAQVWTDKYKSMLEDMMNPPALEKGTVAAARAKKAAAADDDDTDAAGDKKKKAAPAEILVREYTEHHTDTTVHFVVKLTELGAKLTDAEIEQKFKLSNSISINNMHLFDPSGRICRYETVLDIMKEFFHLRMDFYVKRKVWLCEDTRRKLRKLSNKLRFVLGVVEGHIIVSNRKKADLYLQLEKQGFDKQPEKLKKKKKDRDDDGGETDAGPKKAAPASSAKHVAGGKADAAPGAGSYDYLLSMPIWNLTWEKVEKLRAEHKLIEAELDRLVKTSEPEMWLTDLAEFETQLDLFEKDLTALLNVPASRHASSPGRRRVQARLAIAAAAPAAGDDAEKPPAGAPAAAAGAKRKLGAGGGGPRTKAARTTEAPEASASKMAVEEEEEVEDDDAESDFLKRLHAITSTSSALSAPSTAKSSAALPKPAAVAKPATVVASKPTKPATAATKPAASAAKPATAAAKPIAAAAAKPVAAALPAAAGGGTRKLGAKGGQPPKKAAARRREDSESESEVELSDSDSDVEEEVAVPVPPRARSTRTAAAPKKRLVYVESESSDEDMDDDDEDDDYDPEF